MDDSTASSLLRACLNYCFEDVVPVFQDSGLRACFNLIKPSIDKSRATYRVNSLKAGISRQHGIIKKARIEIKALEPTLDDERIRTLTSVIKKCEKAIFDNERQLSSTNVVEVEEEIELEGEVEVEDEEE